RRSPLRRLRHRAHRRTVPPYPQPVAGRRLVSADAPLNTKMHSPYPRTLDLPIYYRNPTHPRYEKWWRQFQFNEAIGFITLFPRKHAIRAEYCFVRQRPMAYLARKEFENQGKLFQVRASTTQNQVTLDRLLEALDNST